VLALSSHRLHGLHCVLSTDLSRKRQPTSQSRRNRDAQSIFLGWTFIGWAVASLWADNDNCETLTIEESDM
jgi:hypothetical protein